ncbi:MAG: hypothetical protein NVSMB65_00560 [Chloroflexota bacterium]
MIVVAGNLTLDDVVLPDGRTVMGTLGGDVLYSGLGAALWAVRREDDRRGDDLPPGPLRHLGEAGLDTAGLWPCPGPTIRCWVVYEWDGRRRFLDRTPEGRLYDLSPQPRELPPHYARAARAGHVAALPLGHAEALVRHATTLPARPLVTLDTHEDFVAGYQERLAALMPLLAAFLPSREEVAAWFGDDDPERHIGDLLALGAGAVVIKMGAEGALVQARGAERPTRIASISTAVRDVTGAGDAFCGGFAASLATTGEPLEAARAGTVSASFAVEDFGSLALLTVTEEDRDMRMNRLRCVP